MDKGRYFIYLSYLGTNFKGWQVQPGQPTVQGLLEEALSAILGIKTAVTGAGRTDSGVHARNYVAHFDITTGRAEKNNLIYSLNGYLPGDIVIHDLRRVKPDAHARFDAVSRTYRYYISGVKDPFNRGLSAKFYRRLNIDEMNRASSYLAAYTDFTSFSKLHTDVRTNNCRIYEAGWISRENILVFTIRADRFLRNMVRSIVGTMLDIGEGKHDASHIKDVINAKDRSIAGRSVPAEGLYLEAVEYPREIFL